MLVKDVEAWPESLVFGFFSLHVKHIVPWFGASSKKKWDGVICVFVS